MLQYENVSELDELFLELLNHSLAFNEYRQQNDTIDTDKYNKLLDTALKITEAYKHYYNGMQGIFGEADKFKSR